MKKHDSQFIPAQKDLARNQTGQRDDQGIYQPTTGQCSILNDPAFQAMFELNTELIEIKQAKVALVASMTDQESRLLEIENCQNAEIAEQEEKIKQQKDRILQQKRQVEDFQELVRDRYTLIEEPISSNDAKDEELDFEEPEISAEPIEEKKDYSKLKRTIIMILILIVVEIINILSQYQTMAEDMGIDQIILRSLGLTLLIGLPHFLSEKYRQAGLKLPLKITGLFVILLTITLVEPIILNHYYPPIIEAEELSFASSNEELTPQTTIATHPDWVGLVRKFEWLPTVIGLVVFTFLFGKEKKPKTEHQNLQTETNEPDPAEEKLSSAKELTEEEEILEEWRLLKQDLKLSNTRLAGMTSNLERLKSRTTDLQDFYDHLKYLKRKLQEILDQEKQVLMNRAGLVKEILAALKAYQAEYEYQLLANPAKRATISPEWPTDEDVINYFKA